MKHKQIANAFFDKKISVAKARVKMIGDGLLLEDIDYVATLLHVRYRQLKAALRARI